MSWAGPRSDPLASCGSGRLRPDGSVLTWRHEIWSGSFVSRPGMTPNAAFLAASLHGGGRGNPLGR